MSAPVILSDRYGACPSSLKGRVRLSLTMCVCMVAERAMSSRMGTGLGSPSAQSGLVIALPERHTPRAQNSRNSRGGNDRGYRMEFHPAVLPVNNIGTRGSNSSPDEIFGKDILAEAITHAFDNRVAL